MLGSSKKAFCHQSEDRSNKRVERNGDPRHAGCVRTCRATVHRPLTLIVGRKRTDEVTG